MILHLLFGVADLSGRARRQSELCTGAAEYLSCDNGGGALAVAVATPSFFGSRTLVARDAELLTKDGAAVIAAALAQSDATLILVSDKPKATVAMKVLVTLGSVEYFNAPANAAGLVRGLLAEAGVRASAEAMARLVGAAESDLALVRSVIEQLRVGAGESALEALDGVGPAGTPWAVARLLERGRAHELYTRYAGADLVGTCAYLAGWGAQLAATGELVASHAGRGSVSAGDLARALGLANERSAAGLLESCRALGPQRARLVSGLEGIDVTAKLRGSRVALVVLVDLAREIDLARRTRALASG